MFIWMTRKIRVPQGDNDDMELSSLANTVVNMQTTRVEGILTNESLLHFQMAWHRIGDTSLSEPASI